MAQAMQSTKSTAPRSTSSIGRTLRALSSSRETTRSVQSLCGTRVPSSLCSFLAKRPISSFAWDRVTPVFSRAMQVSHSLVLVEYSKSLGLRARGIQSCASRPYGSANPAGITPTTVYASPSSCSVFPTASGELAKMRLHSALESTAT